MQKISKGGVYQPFYGVTVISKVSNMNTCLIEEHLWNSSLSTKFSPLPYESYHMTVFDLVVPENAQNDELFQMFLEHNSKVLGDISKECEKMDSFDALLRRVYWTRGTIGIELEPLIGKDARERISRKAGMENKRYKFHMTLAYRFGDGAPTEEELVALSNILRKVFSDGRMSLERPDVHKFTSMREFICYK
ncbi:hypothetical protein [Brazilian marseillevirus]|uniref:hypothetical protein n=1 Tax=Brazilian marseillevirus TaxID=1813599 RepID=UPI00078510AE|nr:hypothetical protein A3303_gp313 [Brazilian marseillevirus]AMQ10821.1 hypothetical protein [Brazilian marseillevirus]